MMNYCNRLSQRKTAIQEDECSLIVNEELINDFRTSGSL
jgi:hypothetical protein